MKSNMIIISVLMVFGFSLLAGISMDYAGSDVAPAYWLLGLITGAYIGFSVCLEYLND